MVADVRIEIAALRRMTVKELRQRHLELFNEETRSGNRQWLFRRLAWRVQALAEGDLSERAKQRATELTREADIRLRPPRELTMSEAANAKTLQGTINISKDARLPMPSAVLRRVWRGHEYQVTVLSNGFTYDGEHYRSLSAIAHKITGSHWNGYYFFGLNKPQ